MALSEPQQYSNNIQDRGEDFSQELNAPFKPFHFETANQTLNVNDQVPPRLLMDDEMSIIDLERNAQFVYELLMNNGDLPEELKLQLCLMLECILTRKDFYELKIESDRKLIEFQKDMSVRMEALEKQWQEKLASSNQSADAGYVVREKIAKNNRSRAFRISLNSI